MPKRKSVLCVVSLAKALGIDDLPLDNRSDHWWDEFWKVIGLQEAERILKLQKLSKEIQ